MKYEVFVLASWMLVVCWVVFVKLLVGCFACACVCDLRDDVL